MAPPTSMPHPPLSAAAEELLAGLERLVAGGADSPAGDPLRWISTLMDEHRDALLTPEVQPQLDTLREVLARPESGAARYQPITREEIATHAGLRAGKAGRSICSSEDAVWAVLALVIERMEASGQGGGDASASTSRAHAAGEGCAEPTSREAGLLPTSLASEQMLQSLWAALKIGRDDVAGALRWLDGLLARHGELVGGEDGQKKLRELRRWGEVRELSGPPGAGIGTPHVLSAASESAREAGRHLITPQDVATAIVRLGVEAVARMAAEPGVGAPPEAAKGEVEGVPEADGQEAPEAAPDGRSPDYQRTRTFRLFVSSTFKDLQAERNVLQEVAFPRVRDFCVRHGARFQAIDLRWGVSEEAGVDQQTMNICLGEIERCHQVTPRPNFLVLLGDRYGWIPPPSRLPADEFERILDRVRRPEDRDRLERWYRKDLNAVPPEYRLRPRSGEMGAYRPWNAWEPEEAFIRGAFERALGEDGLDLPPHRLLQYHASATEQEILAGALELAEPADKVFCFFRGIRSPPEDEHGNPAHGAEDFISADPEERARLRRLKERLAGHLPASSILARSVGWGEAGPELTRGYLSEVAEWVATSLEAAILRELGRPAEGSDAGARAPGSLQSDPGLAEEVQQHSRFAEERRRFFVGREDLIQDIADYVSGMTPGPLAVVGGGGSGKSALLAEAALRLERAGGKELRVARFVGATPGSSDSRLFLESVCCEIALGFGRDPGEMPSQYQDLVPKLAEQLKLASQERPLVLMVDSLDQLSEPALGLTWIPCPLPPHVRMVVSARPQELGTRLERRGAVCRAIGPLTRADGSLLLQAWLSEFRPSRRLQPLQADAVLDAFVESGGNPLYLRLATGEARQWPAWAATGGQSPTEYPTAPLAAGVRGIIRENLLGRLAHHDTHGRPLVSRALGYLAASRHGLAEDELIEVLSRDPELYTWFLVGAEHLPQDLVQRAGKRWFDRLPDGETPDADPGQRDSEVIGRLKLLREDQARLRTFLTEEISLAGLHLPVVLWSRLFFDLEPYLTERGAEGGTLLSFYHRELGEVAGEEYLADDAGGEVHGRLADYFRSQADPGGESVWEGKGVRGLSELPYHLTHAGRWDEVYRTLTDFAFLEQKATRVGVRERTGADGEKETLYAGVFHLQDDYDRALKSMPAGEGAPGDAYPLIVTAVDFGRGLVIRCPWCNTEHPLVRDWLGEEIRCPNDGCGGPLKVNEFSLLPLPFP